MGTKLNLRLAEQHKAVRAKSVERLADRKSWRHWITKEIVFSPSENRHTYSDGSPLDREDPRAEIVQRPPDMSRGFGLSPKWGWRY